MYIGIMEQVFATRALLASFYSCPYLARPCPKRQVSLCPFRKAVGVGLWVDCQIYEN